jgi:hypothetical protein
VVRIYSPFRAAAISWRKQVRPKRRYPRISLRGVTTLKAVYVACVCVLGSVAVICIVVGCVYDGDGLCSL